MTGNDDEKKKDYRHYPAGASAVSTSYKTFFTSSWWSRLGFLFINPIVEHTEQHHSLKISEMQFDESPELNFEQQSKAFESYWKERRESASFFWIVFMFFKKDFLPIILYQSLEGLVKIVRVFFLYKHLQSFYMNFSIGWMFLWGILFFFSIFGFAVVFSQGLSSARRLSRRVTANLMCILYRHYINSKDTSSEMSSRVIDMISNGLKNVEPWIYYSSYIITAPVELLTSFFYLRFALLHRWYIVMAFYGIFFLLIIAQLVIVYFLIRKTNELQKERSLVTGMFSNSIGGIQIIKYYCWNTAFTKFIINSSERFFRVMNFHTAIWALLFGIFVSATTLLRPLPTFLRHNLLDYQDIPFLCLTFGLIFTIAFQLMKCIMYFLNLRSVMSSYCTIEQDLYKKTQSKAVSVPEDPSNDLEFYNAGLILEEFVLEIGTIQVKKASMVAVIGAVGSGKSAFLLAVLNHYPLASGNLLRNSIAYAPQTPWLITGSVRDNILLGREMDKIWYKRVLSACCLDHDLESWEDADLKFVGERGSSLSGGQKARVSLARALYTRDANILILDDVLSALDSKIQRQVFLNICNLYDEKKTILMSLNQMNYLNYFDQIFLMEHNKISFNGQFNDLIQLKESKFVKENVLLVNFDLSPTFSPILPKNGGLYQIPEYSGTELAFDTGSVSDIEESDEELFEIKPKETSEPYLTMQQDTRKKRRKNPLMILYKYITKGGSRTYIPIICVLGITFYPMFIFQKQLLSTISNKKVCVNFLWSLTCVIPVLIATSKSFLMIHSIRKSSKNIYKQSISSIMNAPTDFFARSSIGGLLSVLARDLNVMTEEFVGTFVECAEYFFLILFIYGHNLLTCPWVVLLFPFAGFAISLYFKKYQRCMSHVKRAELRHYDRVVDHFSSSKDGLPIINSLGVNEKFKSVAYSKVYRHFVTRDLECSAAAWFGIRVDLMSCTHLALYIFFTIIRPDRPDDARIGEGIFGAFNLLSTIQMLIGSFTIMSNNLLSADRLLSLTRIPAEEDASSDKIIPVPHDWPREGKIVFNNVSCIYPGTNTKILDSVSFEILPREKIAVIGRTGAGKSSLISVLFKVLQPTLPGFVTLDLLDLQNVAISTLRHRIAIVPQDPYIFEQSIRNNIDPEGIFTEEQIWSSIEKVSMRTKIEMLPHKLDTTICEEIAFSDGEQQLLSLARALVKQPKLIIFDEANAKLDPQTAAKIMQICSNELKDCVVIFIVHRIDTVLNFDKILVLDRGTVKEFGAPYELLQNEESYFTQMLHSNSNNQQAFDDSVQIVKDHYFSTRK